MLFLYCITSWPMLRDCHGDCHTKVRPCVCVVCMCVCVWGHLNTALNSARAVEADTLQIQSFRVQHLKTYA